MTKTGTLEKKIRRIEKVPLSEDIAQQIMALIASGDAKPGERLPSERELCKQFGVGRSSLREALRCLAIVGVLDVRVGEGTFFAPDGERFIGKIIEWRVITERRNVENLFELRLALECDLAAYAAARGTDEHLKRLSEVLDKMESCIDNRKRFAPLDLEFHLIIAEASKNTLMYDLLMMIRNQLEHGLMRVVSLPGGTDLAYKQHRGIFEAIRRRDQDKAKSQMQTHIQAALERYRKATRGA
jgi:GntR family transcriptional regulator, transcriptional repressor for pyruvate dehydrogenase complex